VILYDNYYDIEGYISLVVCLLVFVGFDAVVDTV